MTPGGPRRTSTPARSALRDVRTSDGIRLAVVDEGGGAADRVFLAHATGFCGAAFGDLPALVGPSTRWDFRGHGRSSRTGRPVSWWEMGRDPAAVRDATPCARAVGVGHSMGGAALVMGELERPGRFDGLVLVEPIVFPPPYRRRDHPLADLARRRRRTFAGPAAARENFTGKPPFASWTAAALEGYLRDGLVETAEGVTLACPPEVEAEIYTAASAHGVFERLPEVRCPVTVLVGEDSDTYPEGWAERLAGAFPDALLERVGGAGHFVPMERPGDVASAVRAMWDRVGQKAE